MDASDGEKVPANSSASSPKEPVAPNSAASEIPASKSLTPEEQMAAFEKDLKENDWGHQPC
jgi:hypothetical protein